MDSHEKLLAALRRYVWMPSKWIFTSLALLTIAYVAWLSRVEIIRLWEESNRNLLVIACLLLAAAHCLLPLASRMIFRVLLTRVEYRTLLRIHMRRLPARYLPGGVWHTVGRAIDLDDHSIPRAAIAWMVALENSLAVGTAFLLGGLLLLVSGLLSIAYVWVVVLLSASALLMLVAAPIFLRRTWPNTAPRFTIATWAKCCAWFFLIWTVQAAAFVLYIIAFGGGSATSHVAHTAGIYLFSWAIGFIAFFAPQGIGVFEATATVLAGQVLLPANIAMLAGFRLCMMVVDLCLGLTSRFISK